MELKIEIPENLYKEILTINKEEISKYIIQLMKADLKRQNIKDGLAVLYSSKTIKKGEFSAMTKLIRWFKKKFRNNRKKCIQINPDRPWPRESHNK